MTVLVIAAHPDDEVLGCGGTLPRLAKEGHKVHIAILGEGITSRYALREAADKVLIEKLHDQSRKVAKLLGAKELSLYGLPDNRFDSIPFLDIVKLIEALVAKLKPKLVFVQHGGDLNIDHALTFKATMTATRPTAEMPVRAVYAFEAASSTDWAFQKFSPAFTPNTFFDIEKTLELKIQAMRSYEGETRPFPHPRSPEALRAAAQRWGSIAGMKAAEAFELVRDLRRPGGG